MWCTVKLVEEQEKLRKELIQSILAYVGIASFLTFRGTDGFVRYAMWFNDKYLQYVLGLHAANPDLGGVEIRPADEPAILQDCDIVWDMEMSGYGGDPLPADTGTRSATAALGTQITDTAFRLLVCQRVGHSSVMADWAASGGQPSSIYRKAAGAAAREAMDFLDTGAGRSRGSAKPSSAKPKQPPYTHARILLGANTEDHLRILQDSFPANSVRRRGTVRPDDVPALATAPPKVPMANKAHFPVFSNTDLAALEIVPDIVMEVPMKFGRPIVTTSQPPTRFVDMLDQRDESIDPGSGARFPRGLGGGLEDDAWVDDVPDDVGVGVVVPQFPVRMIDGVPQFPVRMIQAAKAAS